MSGILCLPEEILTKIFLYFPRNFNLHNIAMVCKRFLQVVRLPIFVPYQEISDLDEDDESRAISKRSLVEIRNVLMIYPECKLRLYLFRGTGWLDYGICDDSDPDRHYDSPMISLKKLEPYMESIEQFFIKISFSHHPLNRDLSVIPYLVNLKTLTLDVSDVNYDRDKHGYLTDFGGIMYIEETFWNKFPNLEILRIGVDHTPDDDVSRTKYDVKYLHMYWYLRLTTFYILFQLHSLISLNFSPNC